MKLSEFLKNHTEISDGLSPYFVGMHPFDQIKCRDEVDPEIDPNILTFLQQMDKRQLDHLFSQIKSALNALVMRDVSYRDIISRVIELAIITSYRKIKPKIEEAKKSFEADLTNSYVKRRSLNLPFTDFYCLFNAYALTAGCALLVSDNKKLNLEDEKIIQSEIPLAINFLILANSYARKAARDQNFSYPGWDFSQPFYPSPPPPQNNPASIRKNEIAEKKEDWKSVIPYGFADVLQETGEIYYTASDGKNLMLVRYYPNFSVKESIAAMVITFLDANIFPPIRNLGNDYIAITIPLGKRLICYSDSEMKKKYEDKLRARYLLSGAGYIDAAYRLFCSVQNEDGLARQINFYKKIAFCIEHIKKAEYNSTQVSTIDEDLTHFVYLGMFPSLLNLAVLNSKDIEGKPNLIFATKNVTSQLSLYQDKELQKKYSYECLMFFIMLASLPGEFYQKIIDSVKGINDEDTLKRGLTSYSDLAMNVFLAHGEIRGFLKKYPKILDDIYLKFASVIPYFFNQADGDAILQDLIKHLSEIQPKLFAFGISFNANDAEKLTEKKKIEIAYLTPEAVLENMKNYLEEYFNAQKSFFALFFSFPELHARLAQACKGCLLNAPVKINEQKTVDAENPDVPKAEEKVNLNLLLFLKRLLFVLHHIHIIIAGKDDKSFTENPDAYLLLYKQFFDAYCNPERLNQPLATCINSIRRYSTFTPGEFVPSGVSSASSYCSFTSSTTPLLEQKLHLHFASLPNTADFTSPLFDEATLDDANDRSELGMFIRDAYFSLPPVESENSPSIAETLAPPPRPHAP